MAKTSKKMQDYRGEYLCAMSHAPSIDESASKLHMIPIAVFAAVVILIVSMHSYTAPMSQFYFTSFEDTTEITDFFSYNKMVVICIAAGIAVLMALYRVTTQSFALKRTYAYIPIAVYSLFVIISYVFSQYKDFALWGWNDRFEGTIPLLCYMVMLVLVINSVNSEENIKQIIIPIALSATVLSLIGISQATGHDFFRTVIGQKLIVPKLYLESGITTWDAIEAAAAQGELYLRFTFNNNEIYQTVYNINYVSFYLTLLVPLFTMMFIRAARDEKASMVKKVCLGILIALLIYNLIGSQSSGGYLGIGVAFILAIVLLNKQILKWIKPLVVVIVIIAIVMGATISRWWPELSGAVKSVLGLDDGIRVEEEEKEVLTGPGSQAPSIEYIETGSNTVIMSLNGEELILAITTDNDVVTDISVCDKDGNVIDIVPLEEQGYFAINDDRFYDYAKLALAYDGSRYYVQVITAGTAWNYTSQNGEMYYLHTDTNKLVKVSKLEKIGFKNNPNFGSGRGWIWSLTFPLLRNTIFKGYGADTYCAVFPQNDFAGKWTNTGNVEDNIYLIVDKPHNMYLHAAVGTGCISLIALLALYGIYLVQSFKLFWKRDLENDFIYFAGVGTFLGVTGFLVSGIVDDSTVSVMPMFYTMLGMGIAINMIIKRRDEKAIAK